MGMQRNADTIWKVVAEVFIENFKDSKDFFLTEWKKCGNKFSETSFALSFPITADKCSVFPDDRNDCGWFGIDEFTCERRGCCYDDTDYGYNTIYCFYPTG